MPAAAADAPVGSHQGCQIKKYVLTKVINQITARRARPIYHDLQRSIFRTPQRKKNEILRMAGKSITGGCDKCKSEEGRVGNGESMFGERLRFFSASSAAVLGTLSMSSKRYRCDLVTRDLRQA